MNKIYETLSLHINNVQKETFDEVALAVFRYQAQNNPLYQQFLELLGVLPSQITKVQQIPFLPIQFFKYHTIKTDNWPSQAVFTSSGTTLAQPSQHHLRSVEWYKQISFAAFEHTYGHLQDYVVLALLPSYLERTGSSLVFMVEQFIQRSNDVQSGFFLYNTKELVEVLVHCQEENKKVLLIGVTYGLLDFAQEFPNHKELFDNVVLMETGGMKGTRSEMTKEQVHEVLKNAFGLKTIHSEYGMTELLSQAYSTGNGLFCPSSTMKILIRDTTDPLEILDANKTGGINVIDLANLDTCSFIATDDLGRCNVDGNFSVLGRFDASDLRGCNLLVEN